MASKGYFMRILMLLYNLQGKGTYWRALYLARGLAQHGHHVTLVCTPRQRQWRFKVQADVQPGVTIITAPNYLGGPFSAGWDPATVLARWLWSWRQNDFDIVHGFESRPTVIFPALYWQRRRGARLVLDWCDWFGKGGAVEERPNPVLRAVLRPFETFFENAFRTRAAGSTVVNQTLWRRAAELGVLPERMLLLSNGSNTHEIHMMSKQEARQQLGLPQDVFLVGYVGAIFKQDAILMAQAFDRIHTVEPQAQLLIIGYCNINIKALVATPESVNVTGHVRYDEISSYLAACDVCWLPLRNTGANQGRSPLKIKDYMAAGRSVVVTTVVDAASLVHQGEFGLVALDQPDDVAQAVLTLLHSPERRRTMGQRARYLAEVEFSWERIAEQLERFYQKIVVE